MTDYMRDNVFCSECEEQVEPEARHSYGAGNIPDEVCPVCGSVCHYDDAGSYGEAKGVSESNDN
jgi:hypothetical protein